MAKDPAFLFYPNDFTTGTQFFTDEQVGVYIRILCAIHQHGHLSNSQMRSLCHGITNADAVAEIWNKFKIDDSGKFYNERLDNEIDKRKKHSEKQRENARMRWHSHGNAKAMPLENENENVIINKIKEKKFKEEKQKRPTFEEILEYCKERNKGVDAVKFWNYYEANGWKVGKNPMKNWQAAVRTWEKTTETQEVKQVFKANKLL
jgi:uncharacterized protein YdaU (DUF1376 family)